MRLSYLAFSGISNELHHLQIGGQGSPQNPIHGWPHCNFFRHGWEHGSRLHNSLQGFVHAWCLHFDEHRFYENEYSTKKCTIQSVLTIHAKVISHLQTSSPYTHGCIMNHHIYVFVSCDCILIMNFDHRVDTNLRKRIHICNYEVSQIIADENHVFLKLAVHLRVPAKQFLLT